MPISAPRPSATSALALAILAPALLLASCSFDYDSAKDPEALEESVPNSVQINYEHTVVENSQVVFRLRAGRAEYYSASNEIRLSNVSFAEYSPKDGTILTTGSAASAVFHTDTSNAELSGSFSVNSSANKARLSGDYLAWDDSRRVLEGRSDGSVSLSKDDGSWVTGRGFSADARSRSFAFSGRTEGYLVDDAGSVAP